MYLRRQVFCYHECSGTIAYRCLQEMQNVNGRVIRGFLTDVPRLRYG